MCWHGVVEGTRGWSPKALAGSVTSQLWHFAQITYVLELPLLHLFEGPNAYLTVLL